MVAHRARSQRTARGPSPTGGCAALRAGDLLAGKYRVERVLGEGGMGVVVAAYHELLDQRVAVKLLYRDGADREAQSRLLFEARASAKIHSDHVARVVDVDTGADGLPFIVMELLDGADLCALADERGALPRWLVVDYVLQALEGLAHAHARGIVHRDLKPSNLFLANRPDGTQVIKILDFGISKSTEPEDATTGSRRAMQLTGGHAVLGSPPYMSPEQVRSPKTVDHRTDIWALGVVMYELLTDAMPFGGDEVQETFAQILEREPTPIRALVHGVPEGLERVVMTCLSKRREDRFQTVAELARALCPFGSGAWAQSADRVAATLARGIPDDPGSGLRLRSSPGSERLISTPLRVRRESVQPELHGTASTVAFSSTGARRKWLVAAIAAPAVLGIAIAAVSIVRARASTAEDAPVAASSGEAPAGAAVAVPATAVVGEPAPLVGQDGAPSPPSPAAGDVAPPPVAAIGAAAETAPSASATASTRKTAPSTRRPPGSGSARPALPAGLPLTRE